MAPHNRYLFFLAYPTQRFRDSPEETLRQFNLFITVHQHHNLTRQKPSCSATNKVRIRIAASRNVPERSCRCLIQMFPGFLTLAGLRFRRFLMTSGARSFQIAQRVRGHLRLRV